MGFMDWGKFVGSHVPQSTFIGTHTMTIPSTTVQGNVQNTQTLGMSPEFAMPENFQFPPRVQLPIE